MNLVKPSIKMIWMTSHPLETIEDAGRTCWKSEAKSLNDNGETFVKMLLCKEHEAMIEHASASYRVLCDRGVTHEIVRHRIGSYAQESTRYCDYGDKGITLIHPEELNTPQRIRREKHFWAVQLLYNIERNEGLSPQIARGVLPNALKTEIVITYNLREWRHFFKLRTNIKAHPQMQEVANMILSDIQGKIPILFDEYSNIKGEK